MYVCMYVCMYVRMYVCPYVRMYVCTYVIYYIYINIMPVFCKAVCRQEEPSRLFLVMPLYPSNMREWLLSLDDELAIWERRGQALPVMRELLSGLAYLHQVGLHLHDPLRR